MLICGDILDVLPSIPDESVQCVVTSPPYWGLRDYGTGKWEGGNPNCDHLMPPNGVRDKGRDRAASGGRFHDSPIPNQIRQQFPHDCMRCGAHRVDKQIGLESTPGEYVQHLVEVFGEVRRVLRKDGTLWLNLGDSYAGGGPHHGEKNTGKSGTNRGAKTGIDRVKIDGLKPKDLVGVPWLTAFALQADGWYLRSDNIWAKRNPMPESVRDRCTRSHEYVFMLSKSQRYYFDVDAIAEPAVGGPSGNKKRKEAKERAYTGGNTASSIPWKGAETRQRRDVWWLTSQPYKGAHFATFPEELAEICILAGSAPGDIILDPFCGSGTTGKVARDKGREFYGIDLNPEYIQMAEKRTGDEVMA